MNLALAKKELMDILDEKLYVFAFFTQLIIVLGVLYAALLYTSIASPEEGALLQVERPRIGVIGWDAEIVARLEESLEVVRLASGEPYSLMRRAGAVAILRIRNQSSFDIYIDNTNLLSGYAETVISSVLSERDEKLKREALEERMETADIVLKPIVLKEFFLGERSSRYPPEFVVVMYSLLIPFVLLLPTFLATNMVTDSIVGERERKTYEMLISTPLSKREIVLSKVAPILVLSLSQSLVWILVLRYKGVPVHNIPLLLILLLIIDLLFIALGVLISAWSDTLKESNLTVTIAILASSIAMFAPLPWNRVADLNPISLISKLASNPVLPARDLLPMLPLAALALLLLHASELALERRESLRA